MRSLLVALLILGWMPVVLFKPHIGVLVWNWVSHMIPHGYTFGFAQTFPFLVVVTAATIVGIVLGKDKFKLPAHPIVIALVIYWIWVAITTVLAIDPKASLTKLIHISKILIFVFISMGIMRSPNRLKAFIWVMAASLGFIGIKGGLFTLITGGGARVQGAGGFMSDNNQLAMAMCILIPISVYMASHPPKAILRWPLIFAAILVPFSVLGTQSRGGFAALAAVTFMFILKAKRKFTILFVVAAVGYAGLTFMPDSWKERMETTENATEDNSFLGRVVMWKFSSNVVDDRPIQGGGFEVFYVQRARELYTPPGHKARAPHSIYFEVLGEHGYVGLLLFMTLIFTGWYAGGTQAKRYRKYKETVWLGDLCNMMQLSLVAYAAGGLTVNIATFDVFYHLLAIIVMCYVVGEQLLAGELTDAKTGLRIGANVAKDKWQPSQSAAPQRDRFQDAAPK